MGFLGPVTRLGGVLVRPHDVHVEVLPDGASGGTVDGATPSARVAP